MKILFINPPSRFWLFPPLGLAYVASAVRQEGYVVSVLDMTAEPERKLSDVLKLFGPNVVGLSCTSQTFQSALEVAKQVKAYSNKIKVVFGGSHPSSMPKETLQHKEIDAVICGEGESGFLQYLSDPYDKHIILSKPLPIDNILLPARDLLPMKQYETAGSILTSRGCPYRCNYCVHHVSGYKWRGRSPEKVIEEIELLANVFGVRDIHVVDDNFSFDMGRAKKIMRLVIERNLGLRFYFFNGLRADRIDEELAQLLKAAGTMLVSFGLESTDPQVRRNICKGVSVEQTNAALKLVHGLGIRTRVSVMIGNMGDTYKAAAKTIDWVRKNKAIDEAEFCLCAAYPNTPLFEWVQANGKLLVNSENQPTYFLDVGVPSFDTADFPAKDRVKALRLAQGMVYRKTALKGKSIWNFKLRNIPVYFSTAKFFILHKAPKTKFRNDKK